jgi:hypothetical protein
MQIWKYRLKNDTLNSVFDGDSNETITKKIRLKGLKLCSGKGMASLYYYDLAELVEELVIQIDTPLFHIESNGGIIVFIACTGPKI